MATRVAVIGAGSWGTAVAAIACRNVDAIVWARRKELADQIATTHTSEYLGDSQLPERLRATASLEEALRDADVVVMGVPSHGFRDVLDEAVPFVPDGAPILSLSKGVEQQTLKRMTEVVADLLPDHPAV